MKAMVKLQDGRRVYCDYDEEHDVAFIDGHGWLLKGIGDEAYATEHSTSWGYADSMEIFPNEP